MSAGTRRQAPRRTAPAVLAETSWPMVIAVTLSTVGTLLLIWLVAVPVGPLVCPAIMPPARNCIESDRAITAGPVTVGVIAASVVALALIVVAGRRRRGLAMAGVALTALLPAVAYVLVAWIP